MVEVRRLSAARGMKTRRRMSEVERIATRVRVPYEHDEQKAVFQWADLQAPRIPELQWLYAVPNFAGRLGKATARHGAKLKAEGRKAGYPDIGLDVARGGYHGFRGEMKRTQGGTVSPEQKAWHVWLREQGYFVVVARGFEPMRDAILDYLGMGRPA